MVGTLRRAQVEPAHQVQAVLCVVSLLRHIISLNCGVTHQGFSRVRDDAWQSST